MLCQEVRGLGNTARQCKETYLGLINEVLRRLSITVGESEGKEAFRDDVNQLRLWINRVLERAGVPAHSESWFRRSSRRGSPYRSWTPALLPDAS